MRVPSDRRIAAAFLLTLAMAATHSTAAFAHTSEGVSLGLESGFLHPLTGLDHLVAMVAVGLWGAQLGAPAIWLLPITFPLVMAFGGLIGLSGLNLPYAEAIVALSGLALGALIALQARPPLWIAAVVVGLFAIFHGYAHGRELPNAANPLAYGVGFVIATGLLHLCGILIGLLIRLPFGSAFIRVCGAGIGCVGGYFLFSLIGAAE